MPDDEKSAQDAAMVRKWQTREIDNFTYLSWLNERADRSVHDLTQYPVFPWVIKDYASASLDLEDTEKTFRDLSKPIGALNPSRLASFKERMAHMPPADAAMGIDPPFLYGVHYSTPGFVLYYLVRSVPDMMLRLQAGKYDAADRMFGSVASTWASVLENPSDLKELIPEFYSGTGTFLQNRQRLDLGVTQAGKRLGDVALPPWASTAAEFVKKCREALESEFVSANLHKWIDLIFGCKQRGKAAVDCDNLFYYLTYEGAVDLEAIDDPRRLHALRTQIFEFGQTPKQLFANPHPCRNDTPAPIPRRLSRESSADSMSIPIQQLQVPPSALASVEAGDGEALAAIDSPRTKRKPAMAWNSALLQGRGKRSPFAPHRSAVTDVAFSADGATGYTVSTDSTLKVIAFGDEGCKVRRSASVSRLALSSLELVPGGEGKQVLMLGSWDNSVYLYSVAYGRILDQVNAHDDVVCGVSMSADGTSFVTGSGDSTVKLWEARPSEIDPNPLLVLYDHESEVASLKLRDGNLVVSGCSDGTVIVHDLRLDDDEAAVCVVAPPSADAISNSATHVSWVPDDPYRCLACYASAGSGMGGGSAAGEVDCIDLRRPDHPTCLTPPAPSTGGSWSAGPLWSCTDGESVVAAWGNGLRVFDPDDVADSSNSNGFKNCIFENDNSGDHLTTFTISSDGTRLLYGTNDGIVGAVSL